MLFFLFLSGCGGLQPQQYTSGKGKFRVLFPAGSVQKKSTAGRVSTTHIVAVEDRNGAYAVAYTGLSVPLPKDNETLQKLVKSHIDDALRPRNVTLESDKEITLGDEIPGREVLAKMAGNKGWVRKRYFLANQRFYDVGVMGRNKSYVTSKKADDFIGSFSITD